MSKIDCKSHFGGNELFRFIKASGCKISTLQGALINIQS